MPRYKLTLEYDGTAYAGWQCQNDRPSVQSCLEAAIQQFGGQKREVIGAGRTDAGVHATSQVAHVDLEKPYDAFRVMQGINFYLFNDEAATLQNRIAIIAAEQVPENFHARFSAVRRHYVYRILNRRARLGLEAKRAWHVVEPLNAAAMHEAAQLLAGHRDFSSFRDTQCQAKSPLKTLETLNVTRHGEEVRIAAAARSFLHHQMRIMVGTLSLVGKGKWPPGRITQALEEKQRASAGPTAPPDGLYLTGVDY